jgi:hypothetical protein
MLESLLDWLILGNLYRLLKFKILGMNNVKLFQECLKKENDEIIWDKFYQNIILNPDDLSIIDNYFKISSDLKEKIITIKQLLNTGNKKEALNFVEAIINILINEEWGQYNEFSFFLHTCDLTINWISEIKKSPIYDEKQEMLNILEQYISNRSIVDKVVKEWIIALYDDWASRRKWKSWELKIKEILTHKGYIFVEDRKSLLEWDKTLTFISSKKGLFSAKNIKEKLNITYQFNKDKRKSSDVLIKNWEKFYILEAKHLKEWWWNQDKQFQELIDLISYSEKQISYVWFLDWIYWNFLLKSESEYKDTGKKRIDIIIEKLKQNKNNYFINTYWLEKLF